MMKYFFAIGIVLLAKAGCKDGSGSVPSCVQQKINEIKTQDPWNPRAEVNEYMYNGKKVYLFSSNCCDQYNMLYDADCNALCAPSGGFTGRGDMKCNDFKEKASEQKLIWRDTR
jgi:hypothetical protein